MSLLFFDREPSTWQELEELTTQAFGEMGYDSDRNYLLDTVRGTVRIDVHAVKRSSPIPTIVLCECKHWDTPISQNVVHSFRTVCQDVGAHYGLIISRKGFQSGAVTSRISTNVHLMNFTEFQGTFFGEWKTGAFMILARMRDQLLPILRASAGFQEWGLDVVDKSEIEGVDVWSKYAIFLGGDKPYSYFFIGSEKFPTRINDPRGDPRRIQQITVKSHREYLEIAREAVVENMARYGLPERHFSKAGKLIPLEQDCNSGTKAGAYGEAVKGPHKPTLDEMGPNAERGLPVSGKPKPRPPTRSPPRHAGGVHNDSGEGLGVGGTTPEKKKHRRGRPRKTGRPGH